MERGGAMWEVASCDPYNEAQLEGQLSDGYEPFAVIFDMGSGHTIMWLKRKGGQASS